MVILMKIRISVIFISILTLFFLSMCIGVSSVYAWGEIRFADRMLNVREGRGAGFEHVKTLQPHDYVKVDFIKDGWCAVFDVNAPTRDEKKAIGYAKAKFLVPAKGGAPIAKVKKSDEWGEIRYADRNLNIREARDRFSEHVRTLYKGDKVKVDFLKGDWIAVFELDEKVRDEKNAIGYSNAKYLRPISGDKSIIISASSTANNEDEAEAQASPTRRIESKSGTSGWGELRVSDKKIALKRARSKNSGRTVIIEPGVAFKTDFLKNGWYAVFKEDESIRNEKRAIGYVSEQILESPEEQILVDEKAPLPMIVEQEKVEDLAKETVPLTEEPTVEEKPITPEPVAKAPLAKQPETKAVSPEPQKKAAAQKPIPAKLKKYSEVEDSLSPKADTLKHGFRYKIVEKTDILDDHVKQLLLRVFLDVEVLPDEEDIKDFATTIWKSERQSGKELLVNIFLPGMNMRGLSYVYARFDNQGMVEFWTRDTVLFGTKFMQ